jgi:hypothetical protein
VVAVLSRLVELEHGAVFACAGAADLMTSPELRTRLKQDAALHRERQSALADLVSELGGSAPRDAEARDLLAHDAAAVARSASAEAVLEVLQAMRQELTLAYAQAATTPGLSEAQRAAISALSP